MSIQIRLIKEKKKQEFEDNERQLKEKELRLKMAGSKENKFKEGLTSFLSQAKEVGEGLKCVSIFQEDCDDNLLRRMTDFLKSGKDNLIVILGSVWQDKGIFVISLTNDLVDKGFSAAGLKNKKGKSILKTLIDGLRETYSIEKLGGGGKDTLAQGSCLKEDIKKIVEVSPEILKNRLKDFKP